jgi:hypothetical protein
MPTLNLVKNVNLVKSNTVLWNLSFINLYEGRDLVAYICAHIAYELAIIIIPFFGEIFSVRIRHRLNSNLKFPLLFESVMKLNNFFYCMCRD